MPNIVVGILHIKTYLIFITFLGGRYYHHPNSVDEKNETRRLVSVTQLRNGSQNIKSVPPNPSSLSVSTVIIHSLPLYPLAGKSVR